MKKLSKALIMLILLTFVSFVNPLFSQVTDYDGNYYKEVKIGKHKWLSKNLDVEHYRNGDKIPQVQDYEEWSMIKTGAWCYPEYTQYYDNKIITTICYDYGKLYNWYAVNDYRGLAPEGWHIPDENEWNELIMYLGGYGKDAAGSKMCDITSWNNDNDITNSSKFSALPGGYRDVLGTFAHVNNWGYFWSSEAGNKIAFFCLVYGSGGVFKGLLGFNCGMAVRCIKD